MSDLPIVLAIVIAFLLGSLVTSELIWRRLKRDRENNRDRDGDDLGGIA